MKIRLEDGQIGYVVGGNQINRKDDSTGDPVQTLSWGERSDDVQLIATAMSYSGPHGWGNSDINFFTSTKPVSPYSNILGGIQQNNDLNSSGRWVQTLNWGTTADIPQTIAAAKSYSAEHEWGNCEVIFKTTIGDPGRIIVGGYQECNNSRGRAGWITTHSWGRQTGSSALIASFMAHSGRYGWGDSRVFLYFEETGAEE